MTIRTKSEMATQITNLLADNTTGAISAADVRSIVGDIFDTARWRSFTSVSTDLTLDWDLHNGLIVDDSGGDKTITLPDNATNTAAIFGIIKGSNTTNTVTLAAAGADTIKGAITQQLDNVGEFITVASIGDGNWLIINRDTTNFEYIEMSTTAGLPAYKAGRAAYDPDTKTLVADTGITGVRVNIGQEEQQLIYNNSGSQINNGQPLMETGTVNATNFLTEVQLAVSSVDPDEFHFLGNATHDIPNGTIGLVTRGGRVNDVDTSAFSLGDEVYVSSTPGVMTTTKPGFPENIISVGRIAKADAVTGAIEIHPHEEVRNVATKSVSFSSGASDDYWVGGAYWAPAADTTLTQASLTQTYGVATTAYQAHAFIVAGGAGTVDVGQVGLRATGTSSTEAGVLTPGDSEILTNDITTLSLNQYLETAKKFVGTVTFELFTVSGAPTAYSVDFNYGYSKYDDFWNTDFTLYGIEVEGRGGATDTGFDITCYHHKLTGWTYSAAAFDPGNGIIAQYTTDLPGFNDLANGEPFVWKRTGLNQFIDGDGSEGILFKVTTGTNNSVQRMNMHVAAFYE